MSEGGLELPSRVDHLEASQGFDLHLCTGDAVSPALKTPPDTPQYAVGSITRSITTLVPEGLSGLGTQW